MNHLTHIKKSMTNFISYNEFRTTYPLNETYESFVELRELTKDIRFQYQFKRKGAGSVYSLDEFVSDTKFKLLKDFVKSGNTGVFWGETEFPVPGSFVPAKNYKNWLQS